MFDKMISKLLGSLDTASHPVVPLSTRNSTGADIGIRTRLGEEKVDAAFSE